MRWIPLILLLPLTAACSFDPIVTSNPLDAGTAGAQVVSICYRSSNTTREEVMALAEERCGVEGSSVEPWRSDLYLNECPAVMKRRIAFVCVPPPGDNLVEREVVPLPGDLPAVPGAEVPGTTRQPAAPSAIAPTPGARTGLGY